MGIKEVTDPDNFHFEGTQLKDPSFPAPVDTTKAHVDDICRHIGNQMERHMNNKSHRKKADVVLEKFKDCATYVAYLVGVFNEHIQDAKLHSSVDHENRVDGTAKTGAYHHQIEVLRRLWDAFKAHAQASSR